MKDLCAKFKLSAATVLMLNVVLVLIGAQAAKAGQTEISELTITPNLTNYYGEITIEYDIGQGDDPLDSDDIIEVDLPEEFFLFEDISTSSIEITDNENDFSDDVEAVNVDNSDNIIEITPGLSVNDGESFTLVIDENAQIRNPQVASDYEITVSLNLEDGDDVSDSESIEIEEPEEETEVSEAAVTPTPSVEERSAEYRIEFETGEGGFLEAGQTITLQFPEASEDGFDTEVPEGSISGVEINDVDVGNATGDEEERSVDIDVPEAIGNEEEVVVIFSIGSGLVNPGAGDYSKEEQDDVNKLFVNTEQEGTDVKAEEYFIAPRDEISFSSVTLSNDTVNAQAGYTVVSNLSVEGELFEEVEDNIHLKFPPNTIIPEDLNVEDIEIRREDDSFGTNPQGVNVEEVAGDTTLVSMIVPFDIEFDEDEQTEVEITIDERAGFINPALSDSYNMAAFTTEDVVNEEVEDTTFIDEQNPSNPYTLVDAESEISEPEVVLSNSNTGDDGGDEVEYTITFDTGEYGRLIGGTTITVDFDEETVLDGVENATIDGDNAENVNVDTEADSVEVELAEGTSIGNEEEVELIIQDVENPDTDGEYELDVKTSVEARFVTSSSFDIGEPDRIEFDGDGVTVDDNLVNNESQYEIEVDEETVEDLRGTQNDRIFVTFPEGTKLPDSEDITVDNVVVDDDDFALSDVTVSQSNNEIELVVDEENEAFEVIEFSEDAGIQNPSVPSDEYTLEVSTTQQLSAEESPAYTIDGHDAPPVAGEVSADPSTVDADNVEYLIRFTNDEDIGRLEGGLDVGSSTVTVGFPGEAVNVPENIEPEDVQIDEEQAGDVEVNDDSVTVTLADEQILEGGDEYRIDFDEDAGFANEDVDAGDFTVRVRTSSETVFSDDEENNLTLEDEAALIFNDVDLSSTFSDEVNASPEYNLEFTPGNQESLDAGETFKFEFPVNTDVPSAISSGNIRVNGNDAPEDATGDEQTLTITTPEDLPSLETVEVRIASGEFINPTLTGTDYEIEVDFDEAKAISPEFSFSSASSQVSSAVVDVEDPGTEAESRYTIDFNTGERGRLKEQESEIFVTFPDDTDIEDANNVQVNGEETSSTVDGQDLEIDVPEITVGNNSDVELIIENVTNPTVEDEYTVEVSTTVETNEVDSESYNISEAGPLEFVEEAFDLEQDTVNQSGDHSFAVELETEHSEGDQITIRFPEYSDVPSTVEGDEVLTINEEQEISGDDITSDGSREIEFDLPDTYAGGTELDFELNPEAEIKNPREPGDEYQIQIRSTPQPSFSSSEEFEIFAAEEETSSISGLEVTASSTDKGVPLDWEWHFTTGDKGALESGVSRIFVTYTSDEIINEDDIDIGNNSSDIQVQEENVEELNVDGQTLEITVPEDATINDNTDVRVDIDEDAGIYIDDEGNGEESGYEHTASSDDQILDEDDDDYSASTSAETSDTDSDQDGDPLPVELEDFFVETAANGFALLKWKTATERENDGFRIERKLSEEGVDYWEEIDFVDGQGTTTESNEYELLDDDLSTAGEYKYRLVQEDYDGTTKTYGPEVFMFESPGDYELANNYPNPFNPVTTIPYQVPEETEVRMDVYNILGERVQILVDDQKQPGTYTVDFDGSSLASGVYIVRMKAGGVTETMEITLVK